MWKRFMLLTKLLPNTYMTSKIEYHQFDLTQEDYSIFYQFDDIDALVITAGFGRLALFQDVEESLITTYFKVNTISVLRIINISMIRC